MLLVNVVLCIGIAVLQSKPVVGACSATYGPAGTVDCFYDNYYYNGYQWGICLTNAYIQQWSSGQYRCRDSTATYCYFQCMVGSHGLDSGSITADCSCSAYQKAPSSSLPAQTCFSPDGTSCTWYTDCLAKRFACTGQANYAINYGLKFCNLYSQNYNSFSADAQNWINAVRKCLQVSLVNLLWPWSTASCQDVQTTAFETHPNCYVSPYQGFSVCLLSPSDWLQIFTTIKSSFASQFVASLKQLLITASMCPRVWFSSMYKSIQLKMSTVPSFRRRRDVTSNENATDLDQLATSVVAQIAQQLQWSAQMEYYCYVQSTSNTTLDVNVLLWNTPSSNSNSTTSQPPVNLTVVVQQLSVSVQQGQLVISLTGSGPVYVQAVSVCNDMTNGTCNQATVLATVSPALLRTHSAACRAAHESIIITVLSFCLALFLL